MLLSLFRVNIHLPGAVCLGEDGIYQIHAGYPEIQHSGKATSFAPPLAASVIRLIVLSTA